MQWKVTHRMIFVPKKDPSEGKIPVRLRSADFIGDFIGTKKYRVTCTKRNGEFQFTVKFVPPERPSWPMLDLRPGEEKIEKWKKEGTYDSEGMVAWLSRFIGRYSAFNAVMELIS